MSTTDVKLRSRQSTHSDVRSSPIPLPPGHFSDRRESSDDAVLIREAQAGRWEAFAELAQRYDATILALTLRLSGSEREGRDLFQKALLTAYRELSSYRFQCSFYIWIYRIVARTCVEFLEERAQKREEARLASANRLDAALHQLSPRERIVVELRHSFGLKLETVAAILQISHDSARNTFVRAILLLRLECE